MHIAFQEKKKHKVADSELLQKNEVVSSSEISEVLTINYSIEQQFPKDLRLKHLGQIKHK